jgi:hypothetical protein
MASFVLSPPFPFYFLLSQIIAKKLSIKQDVIEDLKTAEELFPVRTELEQTTILSPLRTPSWFFQYSIFHGDLIVPDG